MNAGVSAEDFDRLVGRIYDAALQPEAWQTFVADLGETVKGANAALNVTDFAGNTHIGAIATHEAGYLASYEAYYAKINPWIAGISRAAVGKALPAELWLSPDVLLGTEYYNDWQRPQGFSSAVGTVVQRDRRRFVVLAFDIQKRYEEKLQGSLLSLLDRLTPHVQRALAMMRHLSSDGVASIAQATLEAISSAAFLVDQQGRVLQSNSRANSLQRAGDALRLGRDGRISLADCEAQSRLDRCLDAVGRNDWQGAADSFAAIASAVGPPWQINVLPLPQSNHLLLADDGRPAAIVVVAAPEKPSAVESFGARYSLTAAEQQVAAAMLSGKTLNRHANERGISIHTARNQLKSLMSKAGVGRQSQLVALMASNGAGPRRQ